MEWIDWDRAESLIEAMEPLANGEIPLWAVFTHSAHCTNFFKIFQAKNNYFNIKLKGNNDEYLDWGSPVESVAFYLEMVKQKYPEAMRNNRCSHCFLWGIRKWEKNQDLEANSYFKELARKHRFLQGEDKIVQLFNRKLKYTLIGEI